MNDKTIFKNGDIIFFKPTTLFEKLISYFSGFKYCHVGVIQIIDNIVYILESTAPKGVRRANYKLEYSHREFAIISPKKLDFDYQLNKFVELPNQTYGFLDIIIMYFKLNKYLNGNGLVCSEFVSILNKIEPSNITIKELWYILNN